MFIPVKSRIYPRLAFNVFALIFFFLSVKGIVLQVCCQRQIVGYKIPDDGIKGRTLGTGARGSGKICKLVCCTITISFNKSDRMILEGLE
jgi:hypothetical protein